MNKAGLTEERAKAIADTERKAAKVLVGILVDEELAFDYTEATDYIGIDPRCVQEISCVQLIEIFGSIRKDCEEVGMNMFVVKDDNWPDEAYFEVYDLSEPRRHISKKDPHAKRGGEQPALLIRFRDDL